MDLKTHKAMQTLNRRVMGLIMELNEQFSSDAEMQEISEHMEKLCKVIHNKSLKLFDDEK